MTSGGSGSCGRLVLSPLLALLHSNVLLLLVLLRLLLLLLLKDKREGPLE